jgi:hypothetical protein
MPNPTLANVHRRLRILRWQVSHARSLPHPDQLREARTRLSPIQWESLHGNWKQGRDGLCAYMRQAGAWERMTRDEQTFAETLPCDVTEQQLADASWRMESYAVLLWSLELLEELPPFDSQIENVSLLELADRPLESVRLRNSADIEQLRRLAELWHWRSRTRQLVEEGQNPAPVEGFPNMDSVVRYTAKKLHTEGVLREIKDEDFVVKCKPYRELTLLEWSQVRSIATERHLALNWLCGLAPDNRWDLTPTTT